VPDPVTTPGFINKHVAIVIAFGRDYDLTRCRLFSRGDDFRLLALSPKSWLPLLFVLPSAFWEQRYSSGTATKGDISPPRLYQALLLSACSDFLK